MLAGLWKARLGYNFTGPDTAFSRIRGLHSPGGTPRADFLRPSKGVCGFCVFCGSLTEKERCALGHFLHGMRKGVTGTPFTLAARGVCVFSYSVPFFSPPVSDSTGAAVFLLMLETSHPSSPSASTPVRCPELPLAPFPVVSPVMLSGCALGVHLSGHTWIQSLLLTWS